MINTPPALQRIAGTLIERFATTVDGNVRHDLTNTVITHPAKRTNSARESSNDNRSARPTPFADAAPALWECGLPAMPLDGKKPIKSGWTRFCREMPSDHEKAAWVIQDARKNIGLPLGPLTGLCSADIDTADPELIAAIKSVLPNSPWERVGKKGCALLFRNTADLKNFSIPGVFDFLADGKQVALPPSIHPDTGRAYTANSDLAEVYAAGNIPEIPFDLKARLIGVTSPGAIQGGRHNILSSNIGRWRNAGLEGDDLATAARVWNEHRTGGEPLPADEVAALLNWGSTLDGARTKDTKPVDRAAIAKTLAGWRVVLTYNEMKARIEIAGLSGFGPALDDPAVNRLRMRLEQDIGKRCGKDYFYDAISDLAHENRFHPVRADLAHKELLWDGTARLDRWLITYGAAEDTPYNRAVGALTLIAAVRRVRKPGCKFDTMTVLEGLQGCGKSSVIAILAGPPDWFTDSFPFSSGSKVVMEECGGRWIVEAGELAGLRKGDHETLKATLSRTTDIARPAYGRLTVEAPRGWIVIGTTNSAEWLSDPTGNRRYLPVKVAMFDLEMLQRDRDQLWAEAANREVAGESIVLPVELWDEAARQQESRCLPSPFADELAAILGDAQGKVTTRALWEVLNIPLERRRGLGHQLAAAMQSLGFTPIKFRFGGSGSERGYERGGGGIIIPSRFGSILREIGKDQA
jgi:hypothetical protein